MPSQLSCCGMCKILPSSDHYFSCKNSFQEEFLQDFGHVSDMDPVPCYCFGLVIWEDPNKQKSLSTWTVSSTHQGLGNWSCNPYANLIMTNFCTCHDSIAVVACAITGHDWIHETKYIMKINMTFFWKMSKMAHLDLWPGDQWHNARRYKAQKTLEATEGQLTRVLCEG